MGYKQIIDDVINALEAPGLETVLEAELKAGKKPKKVKLTEALVNEILTHIRAGMGVKEIQRTVIDEGPKGQKWKLTRAVINDIADARQARYSLLTAVEEPVE